MRDDTGIGRLVPDQGDDIAAMVEAWPQTPAAIMVSRSRRRLGGAVVAMPRIEQGIPPCAQCGQPGPGWCYRDYCPRFRPCL